MAAQTIDPELFHNDAVIGRATALQVGLDLMIATINAIINATGGVGVTVLGVNRNGTLATQTSAALGGITIVHAMGAVTVGDGGGGYFQWDTSSSTGDDGGTIIVPVGSTTGRWRRIIEGPYNVRWWGAQGNNVADDTSAIQTAINQFSKGGPLATVQSRLYFPVGTYKITNTLVFEGTNGIGLTIDGDTSNGPFNTNSTQISWSGPNAGTMFLFLGANGVEISRMMFDCSTFGTGKAQNGVWFEATNTTTPATYTITSISRSANVVTATIGANAMVSGNIVKVSGVADTTYNGTFRALYTTATTVSWSQGGANSSSSGGTAVKYQSAVSAHILLKGVTVLNPKAVTTVVTSLTGSGTYTLTTSAPHFITQGDLVVYRGGTNTTYNQAYIVTAVGSSTTATLIDAGQVIGAPNGAGTTGGTVWSGAYGLRIAHRDGTSPQISNLSAYDLRMQGDSLGGSLVAIGADTTANVKDFAFTDVQLSGFQYGFWQFYSPNMTVTNYMAGGMVGVTGDNLFANLSAIDFYQVAAATIVGAETENVNSRFLYSNVGASPVSLSAVSYFSNAPPDDAVVVGTNLVLSGCQFYNSRTATSQAYIMLGNPQFAGGGAGSIVSLGNVYKNAGPTGGGPAPGWIPVGNAGNVGVVFHANNGWDTQAINVTSLGDFGTNGDGSAVPLNNTSTQTYLAIGNSSTAQNSNSLPNSGSIRIDRQVTGGIVWGNSQGTTGGSVSGLAKDANDIVTLGDVKGAAVTSNLRTKSAANTDLAGELSFAAAATATYTWIATNYTSHPEVVITPQFNVGAALYWITYAGTTSFTVNFSAPVTGSVSYIAVARN